MTAPDAPSEAGRPDVVVRRLVALITGLMAVALTVIFWPMSFVVLGLFAATTAFRRRSLPRPVRLGLIIVGVVVVVTSALILADFTWGSGRAS